MPNHLYRAFSREIKKKKKPKTKTRHSTDPVGFASVSRDSLSVLVQTRSSNRKVARKRDCCLDLSKKTLFSKSFLG